MASSDPVEVAVEILDQFTDDLEKLEKQLDRIDRKKLSVELEIDDNGSIEKTRALLEELEEDLQTDLHIEVKGEKQAEAIKKALAKDETATITYKTRGGGNVPSAPGGGGDEGGSGSRRSRGDRIEVTEAVNEIVNDQLKRISLDGNPDWYDFKIGRMGHLFDEDGGLIDMSNPETEFLRRVRRGTDVATGLGPDVPLGPMPDRPGISTSDEFDRRMKWSRRKNMALNVPRNIARKVGSAFDTFDTRARRYRGLDISATGILGLNKRLAGMLRKIRPTMVKYMNFVALLVPMMVTLAGAAMGVAAAFGAIAVAGGAILGLGLLGYGDSLAGSMKMAQRRIKELKKELFGVFRPATAAFQPIVDSIFGTIPGEAQKLIRPLKELSRAGFGDFFEGAISGGADWLVRFIDAVNDLAPKIMQIASSVGRVFGDILINLFRWAVEEVYNNQTAFMRLGKILGDIVVIVYNLFRAVSFVISVFHPLFEILKRISAHLSNKWVVALLSVVAYLYLLNGAVGLAVAGIGRLLAIDLTYWALRALAGIETVVMGLYQWAVAANTAYGAMARLLALTGVGLLAVAGSYAVGKAAMDSMSGPSDGGYSGGRGSGYGGYGGGGGMTLIVQGDMTNRTYQRVKDDFPTWYGTQENIKKNTQRP